MRTRLAEARRQAASASRALRSPGVQLLAPAIVAGMLAMALWCLAPASLRGWVLGAAYTLLALVFSVCVLAASRRLRQIHSELDRLEAKQQAFETQHGLRMAAILELGSQMATEMDLAELFDQITRTCLEIFDCQQASLMLLDRNGEELVVHSAAGSGDAARIVGRRQEVGDGIAGWVVRTKQPLVLGPDVDTAKYRNFQRKDLSISAAMVVPIVIRDEPIGTINVTSHVPGARYAQEDLEALQVFAANAGTCVRHAEYAGWMRQTIRKLEQRSAQTNRAWPSGTTR